MKHIFDPTKCEWANNQGFINSTVERLFKQDKERMIEYVETLTVRQRNEARAHLQTVLKIQDNIK